VSSDSEASKSHWCIVVADDHGPGWPMRSDMDRSQVQYCRLGKEATPFQRALHRAPQCTSPTNHLTALEEHRECWEPAAWFVRPDRRFLETIAGHLKLSSAAAILSVAARSPSSSSRSCRRGATWTDRMDPESRIEARLGELPGIPEVCHARMRILTMVSMRTT